MSFFQLNNNNNQADFSQLDSSDYSATGIEVFHQTNIKFDDIELIDYKYYENIKMNMAV